MYTQRRRLEAAGLYVPSSPTSILSTHVHLTTATRSQSSSSTPTGLSRDVNPVFSDDNFEVSSAKKKKGASKASSSSGSVHDVEDSNAVCFSSSELAIPPKATQSALPDVDFPASEDLIKRPFDKDFVHLEDIQSNHNQSASIKSPSEPRRPAVDEVLYPNFMKKVGQIADTLDMVTEQEKRHKRTKGCFRGVWDSVVEFFTPTDDMGNFYEEIDDDLLLFWHKGQKTATTVPRTSVDYVMASVNAFSARGDSNKLEKEDAEMPESISQAQ